MAATTPIPAHYDKPVSPWDLQKHMESSGNAFVDARRTDAIEYCFRLKGDLLSDLKKAHHCLAEAITVLEASATPSNIEDPGARYLKQDA